MTDPLIRNPKSARIDPEDARRIEMTASCPDARRVPRVRNAGRIFAGPNGRYQLMHNGLKVEADGYVGPWVTELIRRLRGLHEPQEEKAFAQLLHYMPEGASMLELGSWWAYYSLWFGREVKGAHLYMLEPDPNNLDVGRRNFALNGLHGHFINAAIGDHSEDAILYRCYESDNVERSIPLLSVDDLIARERVKTIDLLLADIQGAELGMLEGARRSIAGGRIRFMVISTHHHHISRDPLMHQRCLNFLREAGARILAEHTITESYSGDGLIVAALQSRDRRLPLIPVSRNTARNSLFGELEYDLAHSWEEKQEWEKALKATEAERQRLSSVVADRDVQVQELQATVTAGEVERSRLQRILDAAWGNLRRAGGRVVELGQQTIRLEGEVRRWFNETEQHIAEANRARQETQQWIAEADKSRRDAAQSRAETAQARAETAVWVSETSRWKEDSEFWQTAMANWKADSEGWQAKWKIDTDHWKAENARSKAETERWIQESDKWWRIADDFRISLLATTQSHSWRLTAPLRALHLADTLKRLVLPPLRLARRLPLSRSVLQLARRRFPRLAYRLTTWTSGPGPIAVLPVVRTPPVIQVAVVDDDRLHFVALLERELARPAGNPEETRA